MNPAPFEAAIVGRLRQALGDAVVLQRGPVPVGPARGMRAEVFVHAARFDDLQGCGGAAAGHWPLQRGKASGWREDRPAQWEIDVACVCGGHEPALDLAALVAPQVLETLARLPSVLLSDPADAKRVLRFTDHDVVLAQQRSLALGEAAQVLLVFRLTGVLQVELLADGGLAPLDPYARPLALRIEADPAGVDLAAERVCVSLQGTEPLDLAGWQVVDAAGHVFRFVAGQRLYPGQELSLWSGRGKGDMLNVYWGRRKAVWNNTGDVALLLDPAGNERARADWRPPLPKTRSRR